MNFEDMGLIEAVEYINRELLKGRSMKDIETNDFHVNDRVIAKRLSRRNIKKVNGQYVIQDGSNRTEFKNNKSDVNEENDIVLQVGSELVAVDELQVSSNLVTNNIEFIELTKRVEKIEMYLSEVAKKDSKVKTNEDVNFRIISSEDKPIAKTVRLYKEVWDRIDQVREQFPHISYQSLLNSLIYDATEKFLKLENLEK